jgi:hypothetical protein
MAVTLIADARHWTIAGNFRLDPRGEPVGTETVFGICAYLVNVSYFTEVCNAQLLSVNSIPAWTSKAHRDRSTAKLAPSYPSNENMCQQTDNYARLSGRSLQRPFCLTA